MNGLVKYRVFYEDQMYFMLTNNVWYVEDHTTFPYTVYYVVNSVDTIRELLDLVGQERGML